ncbi:transporter [Mycena polygramma]|nr:transporter [Mycena polygramma]
MADLAEDKTVHMNTTPEDSSSPSNTLLEGKKLAIVFCAFVIAFALLAVDQTIVSTALPTIASHFQAVSDLSWIASGYFLPQAGFMLFLGKLLAITAPKPVFLVSIAIFELGSLFCAIAPSIDFLIFGRVVAGVGAAGLWVSIMTIVAQVTTLKQRPLLMGLFGAVFAVSSIVGPLLGGVFSDHVSWRWCFYINLPLGAVAIVVTLLFLPNNRAVGSGDNKSRFQLWRGLDWLGVFLSFCAVTLLLIALQWGGNERPWNDPAVITLLVLFVVLAPAFFLWEHRQGPNAILPLNLLVSWSVIGICLETFFVNICFILGGYYLPFLYQVRGHSATQSGIDILPFMVSGVIATISSGGVITITGRPWPFLVLCPPLAATACGLLYGTSAQTPSAHIFGFQILLGFGLGGAIQNTASCTHCFTDKPRLTSTQLVAIQAEFAGKPDLIPQANSIVTFTQLIGSSIGLAVSGAVFSGQLREQLRILAPDLPQDILQTVLSSVKAVAFLPSPEKEIVVTAYNNAIDRVFLIGIPAAAFASAAALLIRRQKMVPAATVLSM